MDLNIKYKTTAHERELTTLVKRVAELGWQGMAWNQNILSKANAKNTSKPRPPITLSTIDIQSILKTRILIDRTCQSSEEHVGFVGIRQLHRVTLTIDDVMDIQALNATNDLLRAFDIVAVTPGNYKVFAQCCKQADIDVISIDFSHRVPFAINKKLVSQPSFLLN